MHFREKNPDVRTLPQHFESHGYTTRCVGQVFHNSDTTVRGDPTSSSAPEFCTKPTMATFHRRSAVRCQRTNPRSSHGATAKPSLRNIGRFPTKPITMVVWRQCDALERKNVATSVGEVDSFHRARAELQRPLPSTVPLRSAERQKNRRCRTGGVRQRRRCGLLLHERVQPWPIERGGNDGDRVISVASSSEPR